MGVYEVRPHPPIALTSSPNPSVGGSNVTFTATLTGNCNVPKGVVSIVDGTTLLGTAAINESGVATYVTSALTVGSHNMTATYAGDFNFDASMSNLVVQVVAGSPTATTLTVSPNPAVAFQTITLTSEVSSQFGSPTGTVTFFAGTTLLTNATVTSSGVVTATVDTLGAGTYEISAVYQATTNFASEPVAGGDRGGEWSTDGNRTDLFAESFDVRAERYLYGQGFRDEFDWIASRGGKVSRLGGGAWDSNCNDCWHHELQHEVAGAGVSSGDGGVWRLG